MHHIVEKFHLEFDLLLSREDAQLKPAPDLLLLALDRFQLTPEQTCFVGDGRYARMASDAAGIPYIHLANDGQPADGAPTLFTLEELWPHIGFENPA